MWSASHHAGRSGARDARSRRRSRGVSTVGDRELVGAALLGAYRDRNLHIGVRPTLRSEPDVPGDEPVQAAPVGQPEHRSQHGTGHEIGVV
jgi:hypothetical protein